MTPIEDLVTEAGESAIGAESQTISVVRGASVSDDGFMLTQVDSDSARAPQRFSLTLSNPQHAIRAHQAWKNSRAGALPVLWKHWTMDHIARTYRIVGIGETVRSGNVTVNVVLTLERWEGA